MSEDSTTPDVAELVRSGFEAMNRRDFEALEKFYAPDAVLTQSAAGASFEGAAAIRRFCEDFIATFEEYEVELEELLDLGNGVCFGVYVQRGRPAASSGLLQMRVANILLLADGIVVRHLMDTDIGGARAAAEHFAQERG